MPAQLIEHSYTKPLNEPIKDQRLITHAKPVQCYSLLGTLRMFMTLLHPPSVSPMSSSKIKKLKKASTGSIVSVIHEGKPVAKAVIMGHYCMENKSQVGT